ncbi:MAG: helix-turn-helix domain-containing protein [Ruminococcaceae bacterium]|nr:helix-turn-helix domain-containing protein [Oscillospiraceae bacterium]
MVEKIIEGKYKNLHFSYFERELNSVPQNVKLKTDSFFHNELEVVYINEGEHIYFVDDKKYVLNKGDVIIIEPYRVHYNLRNEATDISHFGFNFDLNILSHDDITDVLESGLFMIDKIIKDDVINGILFEIRDIYKTKPIMWEIAIKGKLMLLFYEIYKKGYITKSVAAEDKENLGFSKKIYDFVANNYSRKNTSSKELSEELFMSHGHFCRRFKNVFGMTFQNFLTNCRIEKSSILLIETDLPVAQIAKICGFTSCSYFCKCFKKVLDASPLYYRQKFSKK